MAHEIHNSERKSFRSCRRRWDYAYRQGYVPLEPEPALDFGSAFHCGFEAFYEPSTWDSTTPDEKLSNATVAFLAECERQKANYLKTHHIRSLTEEMEDEFLDRLDLGTGMLGYHTLYVHPEFDDWFKPVAVEIPFEVPLQNPTNPGQPLRCFNSPTCGQNHSNDPDDDGSLVVYSGRVDALMEDIRDGGYFVWDHKTAVQLAKDDEFLQLDDQVGGYSWALSVMLNLDIRGFIYAETRKDYPRPPRLLKRQQKGCLFSTAKTQSTTIEVFEPYVAKRDPVAFSEGRYDEYLEYLRSAQATQFSNRLPVLKTDIELENIGINIAIEAADMVGFPWVYPNVSRFHCTSCKYRQPCISEFRGEHTDLLWEGGFIKTDRRYWMEERRRLQEKVDAEQ
jgi:PD-(D/E)XK nuclease superfamily